MCKSPLQGDMSNVEYAAQLSREMTQQEARGPGDIENAWRRFEARYAIPWRTFWALRYRKPAKIADDLAARITAAYYAQCESQRAKLAAQVEHAKATLGADHHLVVEAQIVVGDAQGSQASQSDEEGFPFISGS